MTPHMNGRYMDKCFDERDLFFYKDVAVVTICNAI
jgi:hypothetical protein